ncbi:MAG: acetylornithine deacetylase, partial [Planctomycetota bacterium]|nr:acetylornithine deacetylase [Planctomycetota bacterium]
MSSKLDARIDKQERQLCRFLQQVVRVPTVNPPGENYLECVSIFEDKLKSLGMTTRVVKVAEALVREHVPDADGCPRYNLIARWDVGAKETIHFNGHYDVVPVNGKWKYGPF